MLREQKALRERLGKLEKANNNLQRLLDESRGAAAQLRRQGEEDKRVCKEEIDRLNREVLMVEGRERTITVQLKKAEAEAVVHQRAAESANTEKDDALHQLREALLERDRAKANSQVNYDAAKKLGDRAEGLRRQVRALQEDKAASAEAAKAAENRLQETARCLEDTKADLNRSHKRFEQLQKTTQGARQTIELLSKRDSKISYTSTPLQLPSERDDAVFLPTATRRMSRSVDPSPVRKDSGMPRSGSLGRRHSGRAEKELDWQYSQHRMPSEEQLREFHLSLPEPD